MNKHITHDGHITHDVNLNLPVWPESRLKAIEDALIFLKQQGVHLMASVQDVKDAADRVLAAVQAESSKDDAIIALVQGNTAQIAALRQQLAEALANGSDPAALQGVLDSLTAAEATALADGQRVLDAVNANTTA